jgi:lipoyl(octanoyl) transferase
MNEGGGLMVIKSLGLQPYDRIWQQMQTFTAERTDETPDEIWLLEHEPVYTQGQAGKAEHLLQTTHIPVIQTDRGGQITYHGPGQLIAYILVNLSRRKLGVRPLVSRIEQAVIATLASLSIQAKTRCDAPGVYVNEQKICSLGLRIRRGCSYHGLALNVNMDLTPFQWINPCGFKDLKMVQISDLVPPPDFLTLQDRLARALEEHISR